MEKDTKMKVVVKINPVPAARYKSELWWAYQDYIKNLAQELSLNLIGSVRGSIMEITDKLRPRVNPTTNEKVPYLGKDPVSLNVVFYRKDNVPCDIDNLLKSVMEILQHSRVVYNDSQVQEVKAKVIRDAPEGKFEFEIKSLKI